MIMGLTREERLHYAMTSLTGVTVGDSFGECFFVEESIFSKRIVEHDIPPAPWFITDDSVMAIGIINCLKADGEIDKNKLAAEFAENFAKDPYRGYGGFAQELLRYMAFNSDWEDKCKNAFDGIGSMGNGAAMRIAPLGAWFHDDLTKVSVQAFISSKVTHYNDEAGASAVAVAIATALACRLGKGNKSMAPDEFIREVADHTPESDTKRKLIIASQLSTEISTLRAAAHLGNGSTVLAQDTVPFVVWSAAHFMDDFEKAMWETVTVRGDIDTNCAMVGGIICAKHGGKVIPQEWLDYCEGPGKFLK
jgi:ADP-ribosylglycohydrolase